jgi:predicted ATPase
MLKSVRLKNFKLHEDTSIEAAPITVFIGPNNSGKSSIFQGLLVLRQASEDPNRTYLISPFQRGGKTDNGQPYLYPLPSYPRAVIELGEFGDVVRSGSGEMQIGLDAEVSATSSRDVGLTQGGPIQVSFDVHVRDNQLGEHRGRLSCALGQVKWGWRRGDGAVPDVQLPVYGPVNLGFRPTDHFGLLTPAGMSGMGTTSHEIALRALAMESWTGPDLTGLDLASLQQRLAGAPAQALRSLRYIAPLRGFEETAYPTTQFPGTENLDRLVLSDRSVALTNLLAANARLRTEISDLLKSLVKVGMEFETAASHRVKVWATSASSGRPETLFVNEGSGASQLPFILVPIALAVAGDTVLLAEPEAHLHPKGQCELTRMVLTVAKKEHIQFFIETHSEHVLHVILNAIGKRDLEPSQIAIYSFENVNGTAKVTRLDVDEQGGVKGGLPGFFDQSLDELTEYLETLKKPSA